MDLPELPTGFGWVRGARGLLARADDLAELLEQAGFGADGDRGEIPSSDLSGRHPLGQVVAGERRYLIRRYVHGGLLRWLTGERFADRDRPFDELRLSADLRARGVRTPRVVAARSIRASLGVGYRLALVSERVERSLDLATILEEHRAAVDSDSVLGNERRALVRELGRSLRELHELGLEHVDLQLRNVLAVRAAPEGERLWLIDLDRSRLTRGLDREARARNLARLVRGARRRHERGRPVLRSTDLVRLLRAYAPEGWRDWMEKLERVRRRQSWRHRLGWWLERRAGADPARRDGSARLR